MLLVRPPLFALLAGHFTWLPDFFRRRFSAPIGRGLPFGTPFPLIAANLSHQESRYCHVLGQDGLPIPSLLFRPSYAHAKTPARNLLVLRPKARARADMTGPQRHQSQICHNVARCGDSVTFGFRIPADAVPTRTPDGLHFAARSSGPKRMRHRLITGHVAGTHVPWRRLRAGEGCIFWQVRPLSEHDVN